MKQCFHTIFRPDSRGKFVGWVEEIPGTITHGESLEQCRENLKESLLLMLQTHRDEARMGLRPGCIEEQMEIDLGEPLGIQYPIH